MKHSSYLCKCNNCEVIYEDMNPQVNATKHEVLTVIEPLIQIEENEEVFWGCPTCKTDSYLTDL